MPTLKEYLKPKKKIRKCPHCKSNKGFEIRYIICGNGGSKMTFTGAEIDSDRETFDRMDNSVCCLTCGKSIDAEHVEHLF